MDFLASALLTYLLHSTLLLAAALLMRIALRERRLVLQEALLRAALVGGFVTAGLQVGLGLQPLGGSWALAPAVSERVAADVVFFVLRERSVARALALWTEAE